MAVAVVSAAANSRPAAASATSRSSSPCSAAPRSSVEIASSPPPPSARRASIRRPITSRSASSDADSRISLGIRSRLTSSRDREDANSSTSRHRAMWSSNPSRSGSSASPKTVSAKSATVSVFISRLTSKVVSGRQRSRARFVAATRLGQYASSRAFLNGGWSRRRARRWSSRLSTRRKPRAGGRGLLRQLL